MFFDGWGDLGRVILTGICAYAALVLLLRISGKRTLSKMNIFDLVVTVAFGSILATTLLSADTSLAEGIAAMAVLIGGQYAITFLSVRFPRFQALIKATPALLYHAGQPIRAAMVRERVTMDEILAAARKAGIGELTGSHAVVLETDGSLTVIDHRGESRTGTLRTIKFPEQPS